MIYERLLEAGAKVDYLDPYVPEIPMTREHKPLAGIKAVSEQDIAAGGYDGALICTDHDAIDYNALVAACPVVVDTRNATQDCADDGEAIVKA